MPQNTSGRVRSPSTLAGGGGAGTRPARQDATSRPRGNAVGGGTPAAGGPLRVIGIVMGLAAIVGLLLLLAYAILSNTPAFTITSIDAESTEHVSAESIARLANVAEGTTLLTVNEEQVREGLRKNPWIADAEIIREFPDRLRIVISERSIGTLVMMGSDGVVWCLGSDHVWIEPLDLVTADGQTVAEAALAAASSMGALLVTDVPASVSPQAATHATDAELEAVSTYCEQLTPAFMEQVVSMSAPSVEGISCVLANGVEVSLGSPVNIATKETLVLQLLERYPNRLTYINVRVTSNPSYRIIDAESVQGGTGATGEMDAGEAAPYDAPGAASTSDGALDAGVEDESLAYDDYDSSWYDDYDDYDDGWGAAE